MKRLFFCLFFSCLTIISAKAEKYFEFTPKMKKAYQAAISLRFVEAGQLVEEIKSEDPENVMVYYVENYIDFLRIYIDEDKKDFQRLEPNKDKRLAQLKKGDSSSPYYLFTQAEIRLHWAVARAKFEDYSNAALEVRKAFILLEKNQKKFPDFIPNKKSLGILHSLVGAIPPNYRWMAKLAGMNGSISQGQEEIKEVVDHARHHDFIFEEETVIMYALLLQHIGNDSRGAWDIIRSGNLDGTQNPLVCFAQASVAMHSGRSKEAITVLQNRPKGKQYHPFYFLDYQLGMAKLYRQDADAAFYMNKYANNFKGRFYIKECYQRIAWHYLLQGDKDGYKQNMFNVKKRGKALTDADKKALKAAQQGLIPNADLLRARLLFDGGHYSKALDHLNRFSESDFEEEKDRLEFLYRKGRILQASGKDDDALDLFKTTISQGRDKPYYFACNSALQAGIIKENNKEYDSARAFFNTCLDMSPSEYKSSLHGLAKAGLSRIKGK